jgi:hypothetical protein
MIHTIIVDSGLYYESTWEIESGKTIIINGISKNTVTVMAGQQNYDNFIICTSGMIFFILTKKLKFPIYYR